MKQEQDEILIIQQSQIRPNQRLSLHSLISPPLQLSNLSVSLSPLEEKESCIQMSVKAYILVQTEVGKSDEVALAINAIAGVMNAEHVTCPYDVVVRAEAGSIDELAKVVLSKIQTVKGITRTLTCPIVNL